MSNATASPELVAVLLPLPLPGPLHYAVPPALALAPGDIVAVPLGSREMLGVVWDDPHGAAPPKTIRPVRDKISSFRLSEDLRRFVDWVASYTLSAPGDVLAMALRARALMPEKPRLGVRAAPPESRKPPDKPLSPARARLLETLGQLVMAPAALARQAQVSPQIVQAMLRAGQLVHETFADRDPPPQPQRAPAALSALQRRAAALLIGAVEDARFSVTLLEGATGSGKTEVYFEAIRACIESGRQALVLLPEIALSAQWLERFTQRFGTGAALWHSDLTARQRGETWRKAAGGQAAVVVGARSALFLPFARLGLVVVDEEHEPAFKQEDGVAYHARDMAIVRARLAAAPVVLASATPSLETLVNVEAGRYRRVTLPQRFGGAAMPSIEIVDLRRDPAARGGFLSPVLLERMREVFAQGEQAMLFLNRRGYAPLTLCRSCGHRIQCTNCAAWLVEHRIRRQLLCHHCGHAEPVPSRCPACTAEQSLTAVGPGIERITEEAKTWFPGARTLIMTSDTLSGARAAEAAIAAVAERQVDLIIGTQVVAKGWHFPFLTLVGVVDADLGLAGGDLRAGERTMQLLHQVAGRAGRAERAGFALLQTHQPAHPVIAALAAADLGQFMAAEAAERRAGQWPPFGRLAAIIVSAEDPVAAEQAARRLAQVAPNATAVSVLGPAPAPLSLLRGRYRWRLLLRTPREIATQPLLRQWLSGFAVPRRVRIDVDIDPQSFL